MFPPEKTYPIFGPPGTGKTTALVQIVEDLLKQGVDPKRIAYVAFTNIAADEAISRVAAKVSLPKARFLNFSTIHSMAHRAFRRFSGARHDIMKTADFIEIGKVTQMAVIGNYGRLRDPTEAAGNGLGDRAISILSVAESLGQDIVECFGERFQSEKGLTEYHMRKFRRVYSKYKTDHGVIDFHDMLDQSLKCPPISIDYAIIDEAQDLTPKQWRVCEHLLSKAEKVWIAGDDDQGIYGFSGSDSHTFLSMGKYPHARVLDKSYRIPPQVFHAANKVISKVVDRVPKEWSPADHEGSVRFISGREVWRESLLKMIEKEEGSWLFLARNRAYLPQYVTFLRENGIKYQIGNTPAISSNQIRAIDAYVAVQKGKEVTRENARALVKYFPLEEDAWPRIKKAESYTPALLESIGVRIDERDWFDVLAMTPEDILFLRRLAAKRQLHEEIRFRVDTIHGVKGAEADNVVVFGQLSPRVYEAYTLDPAHEHRAAYVAVTRTRKNLIIHDPDEHLRFFPYHEYFS